MRILFLFQVNSHARYLRRYRKLKNSFKSTLVFSFTRKFYKTTENINFISLGELTNENYLQRTPKLIRSIFRLKKHVKKNDIIYTFGLDTFFIAYIASIMKFKKTRLIYEVGDIRKIFVDKGVIPWIYRQLEKIAIRKAFAIVVTSPLFISEYFRKIQGYKKDNIFLIENKPEILDYHQSNEVYNRKNKIVIGYFGMIRCERSIEILSKIVEKNNNFTLYIRGVINNEIVDKFSLNDRDNIIIGSEYESSKDLEHMYKNIDICWTAYPYSKDLTGNQFWAMTTRFYEAGYFKTPIITRFDGAESSFVRSNKVGITINLSKIDESVQIIESLSKETILKMRRNYLNIEESYFIYNDEHEKIISYLKSEK
jgi:succinoglycan biosynthesis protein ExoL